MKNNEIVEKVENEMCVLLGQLEELKPTDEEYGVVVSRIETMTDVLNSQRKSLMEIDKVENDIEISKIEKKRYWKDKVFDGLKIGVELTGIIAPIIFYGIWLNKGFKFEEEGTITSSTFKGLINKFKPTK